MDASSRYWNCRISLARENLGYEYRLVPTAREFFNKQFMELETKSELSNSIQGQNGDIQAVLLSYFHAKNYSVDATSRAQAGLCLRCDVSYPILKACQKIDNLFGGEKQFTYRDLLPFVLNDDGQTPIVLDRDGKTQLILDNKGEAKTTPYKFFTVEILRTFKRNSQSSMSLENWAYLQTKQNPELKDFLSEFGFKQLSDWALLNRARPTQLERLSVRDRIIVEVFHAVYRRDRRQQPKGAKKCPDPCNTQLQEMLTRLQERNVAINTTIELMKELRQVAKQLRQYDIWSYREPLEIQDPDTGDCVPRPDLPHDSINELEVEHREVSEFFYQQLRLALSGAIEKEIGDRITTLQKSKKYASFAQKFIPGLQLYYCQCLSLKEIAPLLGMTSWDQARRVLNPGELLTKVRASCVQQVLDKMLKKAQDMGLTKIPPEPDYLKNLSEQIEAFADAEIFQQAAEEIQAGKNRSMDSIYAQQLRFYFEQHQ
ncbi:hypothetical protein [Microseira wollei]|uniref:Uncharacterized protein n=1 Tax=Microseira wollei NIES-4236 TaxID=2530354 RepID=A0AAV3X569_9CYAN|nr:hypothetical protein [Microseira wollei]GET37433.1 hypothetical protein MiSe_21860 [Microseira wollei NIES-4236]